MAYSIRSCIFGFNGQEKDNEVYGEGNSYTAAFWEYDPRIGRRWNIDPIMKEYESPYATYSNNPIYFVDPSGANSEGNGDGDKPRKSVVIFRKDAESGNPSGDPNNAVQGMLEKAREGGDIEIMYADDPEDLQAEFEEFNAHFTLDNVYTASHGDRYTAGFEIGKVKVNNSNYNSGDPSKMLDIIKSNLSTESKVIILACNAGG
jgi:RHS repeat-associated protein